MNLHLKILSLVISTFCIVLTIQTSTFATSLGGTCSNWVTITMDKNRERECKIFTDPPLNYKRFPSTRNCTVCNPDDWTTTIKDPIKQPIAVSKSVICDKYAVDAIALQKQNVSRRCGFSGPRWQSTYPEHHGWCMQTTTAHHNRESNGRRNDLTNYCP